MVDKDASLTCCLGVYPVEEDEEMMELETELFHRSITSIVKMQSFCSAPSCTKHSSGRGWLFVGLTQTVY